MKINLGFGVSIEKKKLKSGKIVHIIDNNLPNDYWAKSRMRQLIWN